MTVADREQSKTISEATKDDFGKLGVEILKQK